MLRAAATARSGTGSTSRLASQPVPEQVPRPGKYADLRVEKGSLPRLELQVKVRSASVAEMKGLARCADPDAQRIQLREVVAAREDVRVARNHEVVTVHEEHWGVGRA